MKNALTELKKAYYNALNGNLSIVGFLIPVYDTILPEITPNKYVLLYAISSNQKESKQKDYKDYTIQISTICKFDAFTLDNTIADSIDEQISEILNNGNYPVLTGFSIVLIKEESNQTLTDQLPTQTIDRRITRYLNSVETIK